MTVNSRFIRWLAWGILWLVAAVNCRSGSKADLQSSKRVEQSQPAQSAAPIDPAEDEARDRDGGDERPVVHERELMAADLSGRRLDQLRLIEAQILARAGSQFRRAWLHEMFARQDGYEPTGYNPDNLGPGDRHNLAAVQRAIAAIPRAALEARYRVLRERHGNAAYVRDAHEVSRLALAPDGSRLYALTGTGLYVWDARLGKRVSKHPLLESEGGVSHQWLMPDGDYSAQHAPGAGGFVLTTWTAETGTRKWEVTLGRSDEYRERYRGSSVLAMAPDHSTLVVTYEEADKRRSQTVRVVSIADQKVGRKLPAPNPENLFRVVGQESHPLFGEDDVYGPDGRVLYTGDSRSVIFYAVDDEKQATSLRVVSVRTGKSRAYQTDDFAPTALASDHTGQRIIAYDPKRGAFAIWSDPSQPPRLVTAGAYEHVALSGDHQLALAVDTRRVVLWDLATGRQRWEVKVAGAPATAVAISPQSGLAAWAGGAGYELRQLDNGEPVPSWQGHAAWPSVDREREMIELEILIERPDPARRQFRNPFRDLAILDLPLTDSQLRELPPLRLAMLPYVIEARRQRHPADELRGAVDLIEEARWREQDRYTKTQLTQIDRDNLARLKQAYKARGVTVTLDQIDAEFARLKEFDHL